jgi:hypothetical protein
VRRLEKEEATSRFRKWRKSFEKTRILSSIVMLLLSIAVLQLSCQVSTIRQEIELQKAVNKVLLQKIELTIGTIDQIELRG